MNGLLTSAPVLRKKPQGRLRCQPRPVPEWFQFTVVLLCILQLGFEPKGPVLTKSYDDATGQRGHLLSETFAPASGTSSTLTYQFDGSTSGGLGQLTSAALTGAQTGGNTSTYGTYARLSQQNLSGTLLPATGSPVNDTNYDATGELTSHNPGSSADTLTWDARLVTAGPPRQYRSNEPYFADDTMSYLDEIRRETTTQAPRQPRARTSCQTWCQRAFRTDPL